MNIPEREQLARFLEQLTQTQAVPKDKEAAALIRATCARHVDATYLLVQRAMLLEAAVHHSQGEIARLQGELERTKNQSPAGQVGTGFIDANTWGNAPATRTTPAMPPAATPAASPMTPPDNAWGSGMLGTMATTAAGVVAGGFLFQGIGHLLGNQHPPSRPTTDPGAPAAVAHDPAAIVDPQDGTDLFDTSSVDDYIASDTDANA